MLPRPRRSARQARLATALGNVALLADSPGADALRNAVGGHCEIVTDPLLANPDAVLFAGPDADAAELRRRLAGRDGPLVPLLVAHDGGYDTTGLVWERTLTINTTASGGNASLLSLDDEAASLPVGRSPR